MKFLKWGAFIFLSFNSEIIYSLQSPNYKITNLTMNSLSNNSSKISYTFSLDQNILDIGYTIFSSNIYDIHSGILSLNRGPEDNVAKAYAFPNPCSVKNGCNAITFTKLSLKCQIKIFDISGKEVITLYKNTNSEKHSWDLKDKYNINIPSGLYIFYIKDPTGTIKKGKMIIIR
ncbi:MAG: T9SS type A sorting domain-containing protein [Elusimicrobiales bacterium]|nr:T9SS type A sorting domain-containing protein [Elusimicrobiales bacterium]